MALAIRQSGGLWTGYFDDDGDHAGFQLKNCAHCGASDLSLENTHSPSFWVKCEDCHCTVPGKPFPEATGRFTSRGGAERIYKRAMQAAVDAWNSRVGEA